MDFNDENRTVLSCSECLGNEIYFRGHFENDTHEIDCPDKPLVTNHSPTLEQ